MTDRVSFRLFKEKGTSPGNYKSKKTNSCKKKSDTDNDFQASYEPFHREKENKTAKL